MKREERERRKWLFYLPPTVPAKVTNNRVSGFGVTVFIFLQRVVGVADFYFGGRGDEVVYAACSGTGTLAVGAVIHVKRVFCNMISEKVSVPVADNRTLRCVY